MTPFERFHEAALRLPGATFDVKWRRQRVYSVEGRMFAIAGALGEDAPRYRFKASPATFELLVATGVARPAPYLARAMWVELVAPDRLGAVELMAYVARSHALVRGRTAGGRAARA